ncbi:MAG: hypothetical protein II305_06030 [Clostridia bacterium]|nr:hypothetical protein [Clostridia bacterium]MBQ5716201.1 hypothetical protein [Clostridia bacterium]
MKTSKIILLALFCFTLVTLTVFFLVTFLMGPIKALQAVLYFYLIFGGGAGIWIIGSKIYEKLQETKYGYKIISILFIAFIFLICILASLTK